MAPILLLVSGGPLIVAAFLLLVVRGFFHAGLAPAALISGALGAVAVGFSAAMTTKFGNIGTTSVAISGNQVEFTNSIQKRAVLKSNLYSMMSYDGGRGPSYIILDARDSIHIISDILYMSSDFEILKKKLAEWQSGRLGTNLANATHDRIIRSKISASTRTGYWKVYATTFLMTIVAARLIDWWNAGVRS